MIVTCPMNLDNPRLFLRSFNDRLTIAAYDWLETEIGHGTYFALDFFESEDLVWTISKYIWRIDQRNFLFKDSDDATLFKLTWG